MQDTQFLNDSAKSILPKYEFGDTVLTDEIITALNIMENTNDTLFLTGNAGSGKSTIVNLFRKNTKKSVVVLGPTGSSAVNINGQTIHSFFKFAPKPLNEFNINTKVSDETWLLLKKIDTIIIDEVSMVRADMMDAMNYYLNTVLREEPFGGKQMIFVGDLDQLPPVVGSQAEKDMFDHRYGSPYFFSSDVVTNGLEMKNINLTRIFRQSDQNFITLLNKIKKGNITRDDIEFINKSCLRKKDQDSIYLASTNNIVQMMNSDSLRKLPGENHTFKAAMNGEVDMRYMPFEEILMVKVGCRVMSTTNNKELGIYNGSLGTVVDIKTDVITVNFDKIGIIPIERIEQKAIKYKYTRDTGRVSEEEKGVVCQFPLKLAYSMSIHKSQGQSYDKVHIDFGRGTFSHGQVYVAMSRARTFEGLSLECRLKPEDFKYSRKILEFYAKTGI